MNFHFLDRCFTKVKSIEEMVLELCKCKTKFLKDELPFYAEQKFTRKGYITRHVDVRGSNLLQKQEAKNLKKQHEKERLQRQAEREAPRFRLVDPDQASALIDDFQEPLEIDSNLERDDTEFKIPEPKPKVYNTNSYQNFVSYGKRYNVNSHVLAGLLNSLRMDEGETDVSKFCSASKIDREWAKRRNKLVKKHSEISNIEALIFDGKKGPSKKLHNKEETIEKITCIYEPGGKYLDHFDVVEKVDGTGYGIAVGLFQVLFTYESIDSILLIGGDNCILNSGMFQCCQYFTEL